MPYQNLNQIRKAKFVNEEGREFFRMNPLEYFNFIQTKNLEDIDLAAGYAHSMTSYQVEYIVNENYKKGRKFFTEILSPVLDHFCPRVPLVRVCQAILHKIETPRMLDPEFKEEQNMLKQIVPNTLLHNLYHYPSLSGTGRESEPMLDKIILKLTSPEIMIREFKSLPDNFYAIYKLELEKHIVTPENAIAPPPPTYSLEDENAFLKNQNLALQQEVQSLKQFIAEQQKTIRDLKNAQNKPVEQPPTSAMNLVNKGNGASSSSATPIQLGTVEKIKYPALF